MFISNQKEISALRMANIRSNRKVIAEAFAVVGGMTIVRLSLSERTWWCSWTEFKNRFYRPGYRKHQCESLITGLVLVGVISQSAADAYLEEVRQSDLDSQRKMDESDLKRIGKRYRVRVPSLKGRAMRKAH